MLLGSSEMIRSTIGMNSFCKLTNQSPEQGLSSGIGLLGLLALIKAIYNSPRLCCINNGLSIFQHGLTLTVRMEIF